MENTLEDLVSTIERNSNDNKAEITNVKLWADSWRREFTDKINEFISECELNEYDAEIKLASVKNQLEYWLKEMKGTQDKNQTILKLKANEN
jgi:hypothetical protein